MKKERLGKTKIGFCLIGGTHQFLHGAPVAAELSRRPNLSVNAYVTSDGDKAALAELLENLGAEAVSIQVMHLPKAICWIEGLGRTAKKLKSLRLLWWRRAIAFNDAVVTVERTSVVFKKGPGKFPPLIHIPHGVGGPRRASGGGVDDRFAMFDLALLAGESDFEDIRRLNLLPDQNLRIVGQVKLAGLRRMGLLKRVDLFNNGLPTILYNPHFHPRRGSFDRFVRPLMQGIANNENFNLIIAPHVRLFQERSSFDIQQEIASLKCERIVFDPGSMKSLDMTYTLSSDIYLGDASSQVYEFLIFPRSCVFIDQLGDGGVDDTKLPSIWSLGQTISEPDKLMEALLNAQKLHSQFLDKQRKIVAYAMGDPDRDADVDAADAILTYIES